MTAAGPISALPPPAANPSVADIQSRALTAGATQAATARQAVDTQPPPPGGRDDQDPVTPVSSVLDTYA